MEPQMNINKHGSADNNHGLILLPRLIRVHPHSSEVFQRYSRVLCVSVVIIATFMLVGGAEAGYWFVFDQSIFAVAPTQPITIRVSFKETGTTVFRDDGLINAGVKIRFDELPQPIHPAKILTTADIANISDIELEWIKEAYPTEGYTGLWLGTFDSVYGNETSVGSGVYHIPLGEFIFMAGPLANETTHLLVTDVNTNLDSPVGQSYCSLPV